MARFSIVLPTLNEGPMLSMTVSSIAQHAAGEDYEVLVVDDGSTDGAPRELAERRLDRVRVLKGGGLGVARARNLGATHATGDYLLFMDAHCRVSPDFLGVFGDDLDTPGVGMVGPTFTKLESPSPRGCGMRWADYTLDPAWFEAPDNGEPYYAPLSTGACQAFRRELFERLGRYDDRFTRWGFEDVEMCLRVWLLGYHLGVDPRVTVAHYFREARDNYTVNDGDITYNLLRMAYLHFSATRIQRVVRAQSGNPHLRVAQERLADSSVFEERERMLSSRVRTDDWFFREVNGALGDE